MCLRGRSNLDFPRRCLETRPPRRTRTPFKTFRWFLLKWENLELVEDRSFRLWRHVAQPRCHSTRSEKKWTVLTFSTQLFNEDFEFVSSTGPEQLRRHSRKNDDGTTNRMIPNSAGIEDRKAEKKKCKGDYFHKWSEERSNRQTERRSLFFKIKIAYC